MIKRLENVQVNLVDVLNKEELLNVSKSLRIQQEKAKELESQVIMETYFLWGLNGNLNMRLPEQDKLGRLFVEYQSKRA